MSALGTVLRFVLELVGLGIEAARNSQTRDRLREKAEARSAARERDMLRRFDANPPCTCGHALSEHRVTSDCRRCACPAFVQTDR